MWVNKYIQFGPPCTCSSTSNDFPTVVLLHKRENGSAILIFPGRYVTLNLYECNRRTHLSIRTHGLDFSPKITSRGLWSRNQLKVIFTVKVHVKMFYCQRFLLWQYRFSQSERLLFPNAITR